MNFRRSLWLHRGSLVRKDVAPGLATDRDVWPGAKSFIVALSCMAQGQRPRQPQTTAESLFDNKFMVSIIIIIETMNRSRVTISLKV